MLSDGSNRDEERIRNSVKCRLVAIEQDGTVFESSSRRAVTSSHCGGAESGKETPLVSRLVNARRRSCWSGSSEVGPLPSAPDIVSIVVLALDRLTSISHIV